MMNGKVNVNAICLMQVSAFIYSFSNIFSKYASKEQFLSFRFLAFYALSLSIMFVYAILWQQILKRVDMVVAYSNRLVAMIWGVVWGILIFDEQLKTNTVVGTIVILIGLYMMVSDNEE